MSVVALILAKSKSNRLPGKNTLEFNGQPMFVENLRKCKKIFDRVYVSSDSPLILDVVRLEGGFPIFRPQRLCGETPNVPVYRHAQEKMGGVSFVAVQANSPTVSSDLIVFAKGLLEMGVEEVMTCHPNHSIYGSIWGMTSKRLAEYTDFYHPNPEALLVDPSVDIHTWEDYHQALLDAEPK